MRIRKKLVFLSAVCISAGYYFGYKNGKKDAFKSDIDNFYNDELGNLAKYYLEDEAVETELYESQNDISKEESQDDVVKEEPKEPDKEILINEKPPIKSYASYYTGTPVKDISDSYTGVHSNIFDTHDNETPEETDENDICVGAFENGIPEVMEKDEFDYISSVNTENIQYYTLYADGVFTDIYDTLLEDPEGLLGSDIVREFKNSDEDYICVKLDRGELPELYYEITRDPRNYGESVIKTIEQRYGSDEIL